ATPVFLSLVQNKPAAIRNRLAWQGAAVSFFVITLFALFGRLILNYLNISIPALQGAGGLLLLLVSLELLQGGTGNSSTQKDVNVALVPLGTPLLAGPGAIVATMLFVQKVDGVKSGIALFLAIVGVHLVIGISLMFSTKIVSLIKESGVMLVARIAGLLLAAIAFEMVINSIKAFFNL
ncbi:MAG: NAAT family transporter, partial [Actinobacteria bacterium]|nr:NAAT family transporter [Actinomycetota bacterium]